MSRLVSATETGAVFSAMSLASAMAVSRTSARGTDRLMRPNSLPSAPRNMRPVKSRSIAAP